MMVKENTEMYNEELKNRFLETIENDATRMIYTYTLKNVSEFETFRNKDIFKMELADLEELLYSLQPTTTNAAYHNFVRISHYIDWALRNSGAKTNVSPLKQVTDAPSYNEKFVARFMNTYFTRDSLMEYVGKLYNYVDKALLLCLFEGISGKGYKEVLNLEAKHISEETNTVTVFDGENERTLTISDELIELLKEADAEPEYYSRNGEDADVRSRNISAYEDAKTVFKRTQKGNKRSGGLDTFYVQRKFSFFKKLFGLEYMKPRNVIQSGMLAMANDLFMEHGKMDREQLLMIADQFDTPFTTYGDRNISTIKRLLKDDEFEILYGYKLPL